MKLFFVVLASFVLCCNLAAQNNVGIGTNTPLARLHVYNGASGNTTPFSPLVVESNNHTYINLLSPNANETSILFGKAENAASGGIIYNNTTNPNGLQFRTNGNTTRMVISNTGNVGIGITDPGFPNGTLDVKRGTAPWGTAVFRGTSNISHFNFGSDEHTYIRGGKNGSHVILNDLPGSGNVGIGNDNPAFILDVSNRMRIRSGGNLNYTAGIWLNNSNNSGYAGFIGMEDDTYIGLWGTGVGWKFAMNVQTGALKVNGSEGNIGQVLTSGGTTPAKWENISNIIKTSYAPGDEFSGTLTAANPGYTFNTLKHTITLAQTSRVLVSAFFQASGPFCQLGCPDAVYRISVLVNGTPNLRVFSAAGGNSSNSTTVSNWVVDLPPGTYTINYLGERWQGSDVSMTGKYSTLQIIPL